MLTDGDTEIRTYGRTDRPSYRDLRTHLKTEKPPSYLNLFKWDFESKRFIIVWVQSTLLDAGLLLLDTFSIEIQRKFYIWIWGKKGKDGWGGGGGHHLNCLT